MTDSAEHLVTRMLAEGQKTADFFRSLSPSQLAHMVYSDGAQWQAQQVLAHLVGAELSMTRLLQNILAGGEGSPEDFDLNGYNERKVAEMSGRDLETLIENFLAARQASAALVAGLSPDDLARMGRHPFLGQASVADIAQLMYRHNQIHQREIRSALAGV